MTNEKECRWLQTEEAMAALTKSKSLYISSAFCISGKIVCDTGLELERLLCLDTNPIYYSLTAGLQWGTLRSSIGMACAIGRRSRCVSSPVLRDRWSSWSFTVLSFGLRFLFVSAYHGYAQLGDEHVPEPAKWEDFPVVNLEFVRAVVEADTDLRMTFRAELPECSDPTRYRVVAKLLMAEPGHTRTGKFYRTFLALSNCWSEVSEVEVVIPDYKNIWDVVGTSYQVHCRYLLIDTKTGYRNIFRKKMFLMKVG